MTSVCKNWTNFQSWDFIKIFLFRQKTKVESMIGATEEIIHF